MIVTCDHCGARYKLDDSRISGRGAKITCPRCRHIFVVYKDGGTAAAAPESAETTAADSDGATEAAEVEAEAPTLDVHGLDFRKVGIQSWKVKVKIGLVYDFSDYKTLAKYIQDGRVTASDLLSHNGTDWTAIGDIDDLPQHFVQVYLDAETAQAQAQAQAALEEAQVADFEGEDEPTNIMGMDNLADAIGSDQASQVAGNASAVQLGGSGTQGPNLAGTVEELFTAATLEEDAGPRFVDPFEQRKKARQAKRTSGSSSSTSGVRSQGRRKPPPPPQDEKSSGSGLLLAGLFVVALVGGGFWWSQQAGLPGGTAATAPPSPKPPPKAKRKAAQPTEPDKADPILPDDIGDPVDDGEQNGTWYEEEDEPQLRPVVPEWARQGKAGPGAPPPRTAANPSAQPAGAPPPEATPPGAGGDVQYSTMTATDHYQAGRAAMGRGRYAEAAQAFGQAHTLSPGNAAYEGAYGAALFRSGDAGTARGHLERAAQQGHNPSLDYLGDIASSEGDVAGAIGYYRQYLATNPRDAGRVQEKIDRLNGA